ncbi:hypothetical protein CLOSTASPAR_00721 [[Clostridium] asparagiforme DSM 15981]|jgi:hypothetical protein|uniref:Uncharacterized protein n=1 Tax=[Clostridium] asparagiforme DSM 15981 TaxID=518636 RepID=C0CUM9_9FIRM|nr:hypothetical protein CLOSTASPAR_00721 [[Clostridium] asparagiforme DSM 15981]
MCRGRVKRADSVTGKVPGAWGKLCKFLRALLAFRGGMVTVQTALKKFKSLKAENSS